MDEITLVRAIAPPAPGLPAAVRDAARATMLAEIATEREAGTIPGRATVPRSRRRAAVPRSRRLVRWGIAGAALSAAAASAAILLPSVLAGPPSSAARRVHPPATATAVLLRAARPTAAIPDLHPRPDQFVYTESVSRYVTEGNRRTITRAWLSADGWHGGLTLLRYPPGKRWFHGFPMYNCRTLPHANWYWKASCPSPPAYVTKLPRTVKAMKRYLLRSAATGQGTPPAAGAIMGIVSGTCQFLVPHRASALMFQALSQIEGIRVIDHATTLAGHQGIAVAAYDPSHGTLDELIFDPKTYLYVGDSQIALNGTTMPRGTVNGNAVLRIAVVGKAGQLP
ncbi:MAG TPA: CU044_5270 family protein [Streptosporangiaceae bacterium]|nr:CU044_5270 family protein [Streptosporangiaceae bacterium]